LHFYTYLAVALAFSHQFATGADFMSNSNARVLWGAMYAGVGALVLWYRFTVPLINASVIGVRRARARTPKRECRVIVGACARSFGGLPA